MISSGQKTGGTATNLRKKQKNKWLCRGLKQGAGRANVRKKEKTNRLVGAKTRGGMGKPKEKRKLMD